jgi:beta-lactamase regulating signal transducer with metallopeptidase domain
MTVSLEWLRQFAIDWWRYVVQTGWQAALVGSLLLVVVHVAGRRWPAPLRYALLVLALLKFACPPLLPAPRGVCSQFIVPKVISPQREERKPAPVTAPRAAKAEGRPGAGGLPLAPAWAAGLMGAHLLGAAILAGLIWAQTKKLRRLVRASRARLDRRLHDQYRDLAIELGVLPIPPLVISDDVEAPMAFGFSKRIILLPAAVAEHLSPAELRAVLAHELAHCQRGDLWLNGVQLILLVAWWFHPILWFLNHSLREVREDCCDDLLLARGLVSNDAYCDVLLRAAAELSPVRSPGNALGFSSPLHPLGRRIARITDWSLQRRENVSAGGAAAVLLAAALLLPGLGESEARVKPAATPSSASTSAGEQLAKPAPMRAAPRVPRANPTRLERGVPVNLPRAAVPNAAATASRPAGGMAAVAVASGPARTRMRAPQAAPIRSRPWPGLRSSRPGLQLSTPGVIYASYTSLVQAPSRFPWRGSYLLWAGPPAAGPGLSGGIWVDRLPWSGAPGVLPMGLPVRWSLARPWGR